MSLSLVRTVRLYEDERRRSCLPRTNLYQSETIDRLTYFWIGHDHHDVSVGRETFDVAGEQRVSNLHAVERSRHLATAQLELFDDVADLLESVGIVMLLPLAVTYHLRKFFTSFVGGGVSLITESQMVGGA